MRYGSFLIAALPFALALGCTLRLDWPEHEVVLLLEIDDAEMHTVGQFDVEFSIQAIRLQATSIALLPCDDADDSLTLGPGTAYAHAIPSSTTRVGGQVLSVLGDGATLATWTPPEGRYCEIEIEWGPSDNGQPTVDVRGAQRLDGDAWHSFEWKEMARATSRLRLTEPVALGSSSEERILRLRPKPLEWISEMDVANGARSILQHAVDGWEVAQ